jgi:hypothetical protein
LCLGAARKFAALIATQKVQAKRAVKLLRSASLFATMKHFCRTLNTRLSSVKPCELICFVIRTCGQQSGVSFENSTFGAQHLSSL